MNLTCECLSPMYSFGMGFMFANVWNRFRADWAACVLFFQNHLDDIDPRRGVSWVTIRYMIGEVHYGGRVTDDFDKRLLVTFCKYWFNDGMMNEAFQFSDGYVLPPKAANMEATLAFLEDLSAVEDPGVYGLHRNAGIT